MGCLLSYFKDEDNNIKLDGKRAAATVTDTRSLDIAYGNLQALCQGRSLYAVAVLPEWQALLKPWKRRSKGSHLHKLVPHEDGVLQVLMPSTRCRKG